VFHPEHFDRLFMTMFAKRNSKVNFSNICLTSLILVGWFTPADMNLEYISQASKKD